MAGRGIKIEIDGREYWLPGDLDLNDAILRREQGFTDDQAGFEQAVRWMAWRILLRDNPEMTLEDAGARIKYDVLLSDDDEEDGPPAIPLPEPEAQSGTSGDDGNGSGSTEATVQLRTQGISGRPR